MVRLAWISMEESSVEIQASGQGLLGQRIIPSINVRVSATRSWDRDRKAQRRIKTILRRTKMNETGTKKNQTPYNAWLQTEILHTLQQTVSDHPGEYAFLINAQVQELLGADSKGIAGSSGLSSRG